MSDLFERSEQDNSDVLLYDLFTSPTADDISVLLFDNIRVDAFDGVNTTIVYTYKLPSCGSVFESSLLIPLKIESATVMHTLFAIGMCSSLWFWMGFATPTIHIGLKICEMVSIDESTLLFWNFVFHGVLLEYMYMNNLEFSVEVTAALIRSSSIGQQSVGLHCLRVQSKLDVLVPIGGGKDSLFVWQQIKEDGLKPLLLHVTDGLMEYESNWRTQKLLEETGDEYIVVKHVFYDILFERRRKSSMRMCGHPWAAMVMFDSILVASLSGLTTVKLGFERSADEGNNVFVNGEEVNHQFDKSSIFLSSAQKYVRSHISSDMIVESAVTGLWELEITREFSDMHSPVGIDRFHAVFLSCNEPLPTTRLAPLLVATSAETTTTLLNPAGNSSGGAAKVAVRQKQQQYIPKPATTSYSEVGMVGCCEWCCACDKCAFVCLLLRAWLPPKYVTEIVFSGRDMLCTSTSIASTNSSGGGSGHDNANNIEIREDEIERRDRELDAIFARLLGVNGAGFKPFDCVGTAQEARAALHLCVLRCLEQEYASAKRIEDQESPPNIIININNRNNNKTEKDEPNKKDGHIEINNNQNNNNNTLTSSIDEDMDRMVHSISSWLPDRIRSLVELIGLDVGSELKRWGAILSFKQLFTESECRKHLKEIEDAILKQYLHSN